MRIALTSTLLLFSALLSAAPIAAAASTRAQQETCPNGFAALLYGKIILVDTCSTGSLRAALTQQIVAYYANPTYPAATITRNLKADLTAPTSQLGVGGSDSAASLAVLEVLFGSAVTGDSVDGLIGNPSSTANAALARAVKSLGEPWPVQPWLNNAEMLREDVQIVGYYLNMRGSLVGTTLGKTVLPAGETGIISAQIENNGTITVPECGPIYNHVNAISGHECILTWTVMLPSKNRVVVSGSTGFTIVHTGLYSAVTAVFGRQAPRALSESFCLTAPGIFTFDAYSGESGNGWGNFRPLLVRTKPQVLNGAFQLDAEQSSGINALNVLANAARAQSLLQAANGNWMIFQPRCEPYFNDVKAFESK